MKFAFGFFLVVWPLAVLSAQGQTDIDLPPDKLKEIEQLIKSKDPSELDAFSQALQQPVLLVLHLGRLGAYPLPKGEQQMVEALPWPMPDIKNSFKVEFPFVVRATIESQDGTYPQRVLILRQENQNSPWVVVDHFLPAKDGSVKEKQAMPSPELQAKARMEAAAELEKNKECSDAKQ